MMEKVVAFIPVRGGSKTIPLKNIKTIAGKPLVFWAIEAALQTDAISKVYVATDSELIKSCVNSYFDNEKLFVIGRDPQNATDNASSEAALLEFCNKYSFNDVFFVQATSPLLSSSDLTNAWNYYRENRFDSLLSVVRQKRFLWDVKNNGQVAPINYDPNNRPRRQEFDGFLVENGAFYLSSRNNILKAGCRISGKTGIYEMCDSSYYEIDEEGDWIIVESLLAQKKLEIKNEVK